MTSELYPLNSPALVACVFPAAVNGIAVVLIGTKVSTTAHTLTPCTIEVGTARTSLSAVISDAFTGPWINSFGEERERERRERGLGKEGGRLVEGGGKDVK